MHKSNKFAYTNILQFSLDVFFLLLTYIVAYYIECQYTLMRPMQQDLWILIIFAPIWVSVMGFCGMYDKTTFYYLDRVFRSVVLATFCSSTILGAMLFFVKETNSSRLFITTFIAVGIVIMFLERWVFCVFYSRTIIKNFVPRIVLVCSQQTLLWFVKYLKKTHIRYNIVDIIQFEEVNNTEDDLNELDSMEKLREILKNRVVDEVVLAVPNDYNGVEKYILLCEQMGITVHLILNLLKSRVSHVHVSMLGPLPMLTFNTVTLNPFQKVTKRILDIVGSVIGIIITCIVAIFIIPAIKFDSPGPAIFKQKRVGRNGRIFNFYKFRTMCINAEAQKEELQEKNQYKNGLMFKIKGDPRITRVGTVLRKTNLDELPQFFNVFMGDMSLVGTRPPTLDEVAQYELEHLRRLSIKPGITGMWQVSGRSNITDFHEVVALDVWYIDNWSLWLDIIILCKTISQILRSTKAAY